MSRPAQGTYIIYNRVLSASGEILAITFNGVNNTLTVTPKTGAESQVVSGVKISAVFNVYSTFLLVCTSSA